MNERVELEESCGNVFADLDLPDAEELHAKALLSILIEQAMNARGWTQEQAAVVMGTTQPKVSDLVRGKLEGFTIDRLFRYLNALGLNVCISVEPVAEEEEQGHLLVATVPRT